MAPSILVVDDEADLVATYKRLLARQGHRVITAATRQAGLDALRTPEVLLAVVDLRLPDGDGLDLVRAAQEAPQRVPVIVVTAYASETSRRQALAAGASAYLAKPFAIATFADLVQKLLTEPPPH